MAILGVCHYICFERSTVLHLHLDIDIKVYAFPRVVVVHDQTSCAVVGGAPSLLQEAEHHQRPAGIETFAS